ncbi:hypothetical protein LPB67_11400 [Undibacterium sp. Jales W-56]|uniref:hypothetical protein n=1 Tax=Undibacterium sp. Jales W-56 TaxID=2897325 RepID=UPI0021D28338|nr:hypothetical protein [Undibacterium sp. Jales W-56]MCU6434378.1 hypothetical protein [Undibacterium sp. Jales W-56]
MTMHLPDLPADIHGSLPEQAIATATRHIADILALAIEHGPSHKALIVADTGCGLTLALSAAYRRCLPDAQYVDFDQVSPDEIHAIFDVMAASDLVVLVQTTSFRLDAYRVRVELFKRGLKVIEHLHLSRLTQTEALIYIDSLAYDPAYYRGVGRALKHKIDRAQSAVVESGEGARLVFASPLESAKLNIGDYTGMTNVGGQFPIGEVFTEAQDLEAVSGRVRIFVFGDTSFLVNQPARPITLIVEKGRVSGVVDSTPEFDQVLTNIRAVEGEVWLRELGFGLNRAFSAQRTVCDIGTYERMCGIHLSLGAKHGVYTKPQLKRKDCRFHVDVFAVTEAVLLDDEVVYRDGAWIT